MLVVRRKYGVKVGQDRKKYNEVDKICFPAARVVRNPIVEADYFP